ncbi:unnamed protein product [Paramecium sonneborni]|uniref:Uncharacterized protein n=1 Tax=Paramecium sonneborni TaxID=65129 RepID=A0A8S1PCE6_9CILI|nr:unnamed protein product [Paramecium sonneborni]
MNQNALSYQVKFVVKQLEQIQKSDDDEFIKENPQIRIQGSNRYDNLTLLGELIGRGSNSTEMPNCASNEEIDKYTANSNLYYSYSFHQLNKELYASLYQKTENIHLTSLYYKAGKYIKFYYQYSQSFLEYNPFYFSPRYSINQIDLLSFRQIKFIINLQALGLQIQKTRFPK